MLRIAPLRAAARSPAGFVARSSRTAPGTHRRSRLASGPGGLQQNENLFLREPLAFHLSGPRKSTIKYQGTKKRRDPSCEREDKTLSLDRLNMKRNAHARSVV